MFDTICTLPLVSDLFCQAIHPTEPIVSVGLVSGHVQTFRLPSVNDDDEDEEERAASESGTGMMETMWKTRRHEGSCRTLGYGTDGAKLFSAGTDGLIKVADMATGRVTSKIATPFVDGTTNHQPPSLLHPLTPSTLLLATDTSALHTYDIRLHSSSLPRHPSATHHPHGTSEYISSLTPLPPSPASSTPYPKQFLTTAGSTLAITDLRRGTLALSAPQDSELLSSVHMTGLSSRGTSTGAKALVGTADGVLALWEHGVWDDLDERIVVDKGRGGGASLDVLTLVPRELAERSVAVGLDDGTVRVVRVGVNKVVAQVRHDEVERVAAVGFDVGGRMVSGGGAVLKVWHWGVRGKGEGEESEDEDEDEGVAKRGRKDSSDEESESSEEESRSKKRKKRKRGKGKEKNPTGHRNGILGFKGLD